MGTNPFFFSITLGAFLIFFCSLRFYQRVQSGGAAAPNGTLSVSLVFISIRRSIRLPTLLRKIEERRERIKRNRVDEEGEGGLGSKGGTVAKALHGQRFPLSLIEVSGPTRKHDRFHTAQGLEGFRGSWDACSLIP